MAARQERHEHQLDDLVLTHHAHRDGAPELLARLARQLEELHVVRSRIADLDGGHARAARVSHARRPLSKSARDPAVPDAPSPSSPRGPAPADSVVRPEPGLARGRWEAPPWAFTATLVTVVLGGLAWLALALRTRRSPR